ncbi:MAG: calcineurin-like phosphoesterase C-terminal domain-containing protein [Prevotella sp.]
MEKYALWSLSLIFLTLVSCSSDAGVESVADEFSVKFDLPQMVDVTKGGEYVFMVENGEAPVASDVFILESGEGISYICPFVNISNESFTVRIPAECETGYYKVYLKRNDRKRQIGQIYLSVGEKLNLTVDAGTTVYGRVASEEGGIKGVVVSDGVEVAETDEDGIYQLKSDKKWGYVFISIPSGYEVSSDGVLPQFFQRLKANAGVPERQDFTLTKVSGQDTYKVLMLGDMHLANRTADLSQFSDFTADLNNYRSAHPGEKMYAIALGDMTWDLYWYSNNFAIPEYLNTINKQVKDLQIFHTIGNHDYDYKAVNDFDAESKYTNYIAPVYYSFNIGKIHYVVIDDIDCDSYDGTTSRNYEKRISPEQLSWLAKDLAYVDKSTPLVVVMHAQLFYPSESDGFKVDHDVTNTAQFLNLLKGYKVNIVTGHTHMNFNVTPESPVTQGQEIYEHNTGAICASWWWSDYLTPGIHISLDGTPGGYAIWDVSGTNLQWIYKATGTSEDYQFRSYDLNKVHFSLADVPQMPSNISATVKNKYMQYVNAYPENSDNEVLINIWNWNPAWTLTVTDEKGNNLVPEAVWAYDPLHVAAVSVKRFNSASLSSTPNFITEKFPHFFKVKAGDADTDLTITVKDEFGHTWTEEMQRPKEFTTDAYKLK